MKSFHVPCNTTIPSSTFQESNHSENVSIIPSLPSCSFDGTKSLEQAASKRSRRLMLLSNSAVISTVLFPVTAFVTSSAASSLSTSNSSAASSGVITEFSELPNSGGVKALDLRLGSGSYPVDGDQVAIHYYGRLAAKQGWRFDSTYDHKDSTGDSIPFTFILGSNSVISGIEASVRSMRVGGIRRVIIPPSQGYQNANQEPLPPNFFDRQRLFTTIFNPTRLANGEGSTLGTLIFDVELVNVKH